MRALVKERPDPGLSLLDIEMPRLEQVDDVLLRIVYCAICVGETKVYDWNGWAATDPTLQLPTVLGHEVAAEVAEVGPQVTRFRPGDRVTVDPLIHCGVCEPCRRGFTNMCDEREIYGKRRGAFAEYAVVPMRALCKVPDSVTMDEAALLENLGVAVHAVEAERHDPGDTGVVIGCGPIGIYAQIVARLSGAELVAAADISPVRLELARKMGADFVFNAQQTNVEAEIEKLTKGLGADIVVELTGNRSVANQAAAVLRRGGDLVLVGLFDGPVEIDLVNNVIYKEANVYGVTGRIMWDTWWSAQSMLLSGKLDISPVITHHFKLADHHQAFELAESGKTGKIVFDIL